MTQDNKPINPIYKSIALGAFWAGSMRWLVRGIGLINVVVVARILSPEDFGLVAMASVVFSLVAVFLDFGVEIQVLRSERTDANFLNTAWTMQILRGFFLGICLAITAPLATSYFGRPELDNLMLIYALAVALSGFGNIGVILFRKELNFAADFRYEVYSKVVSVTATIALAYWLQNYWALIFGQMVGSVGRIVLSFAIHPYRPKFRLHGAREFLRFTVFSTGIGVGIFLQHRLDFFVIGKIGTTALAGTYNMAVELSSMFIGEIVGPVARSLTPNYAYMKNDLQGVRATFLNVLAVIALIVWPLGFGLAGVSHEAVLVLLGPKWTMVPPLLIWLAIAASLRAIITQISGNLLMVLHKEHVVLQCAYIRLLLIAPFVILGGIYWGPAGVVRGIVIASVLTLPIIMYIVGKHLEISVSSMYERLWRPTLAAAAMYAFLSEIPAQTEAAYLWLPAKVIAGAIIYAGVLITLAFLFKNPLSAENILIKYLWSAMKGRGG